MDLGKNYLALSVKDIRISKEFYEKLGFKADPECGGIEQKWLILRNGNIQLGLYQDMFPKNTITFNPDDARGIYKHLQSNGLQVDSAGGLDKKSGPCYLMLTDPDGNPILIDQHQ